jgi:ribosome-associated translation inhibitor RaiA
VPKNYSIQFIGLNDSKLSSADKYSLQKLAESEAMKLQRKVKQQLNMTLHLKEHGKKDKGREKFSITLHTKIAGKTIISEHDDWDPFGVTKSAFDHVEQEAFKIIGKQLAKDKKII